MTQLKKVKNIVQVIDIFWCDKFFIIELEYADKGDLW